ALTDNAVERGADCSNIPESLPGVCFSFHEKDAKAIRGRLGHVTDDDIDELVEFVTDMRKVTSINANQPDVDAEIIDTDVEDVASPGLVTARRVSLTAEPGCERVTPPLQNDRLKSEKAPAPTGALSTGGPAPLPPTAKAEPQMPTSSVADALPALHPPVPGDTPSTLDFSTLDALQRVQASRHFPSPDLVDAAAGLLP